MAAVGEMERRERKRRKKEKKFRIFYLLLVLDGQLKKKEKIGTNKQTKR